MLNIAATIERVKEWVDPNIDRIVAHQERRRALHRSGESWGSLPERVFEEHAPVFVLSTGRCGTALLTRLMRKVPGVLCHHAPSPELLLAAKQAYEQGHEQFEAFKLAISTSRFELVADCVLRGRRYVETNQRVTFFAPQLRALFPRAKFVHLVRHPGAFVRSGLLRNYYGGSYWDVGRITPCAGEARQAWPRMSSRERCAWLWNETNRFIEHFKPDNESQRVLTIKAEELFTDWEATDRLLAHCDLPRLPARSVERLIRQPVNAQRPAASVPSYGRWKEAEKEEVRRWAGLAETYGYAL